MFNLREYRRKPARLADYLPWAGFIEPGIVLNKDGGFQTTLRFRGPDLDSSTDAELVTTRARLNNALRRLGSRWCIHAEAMRREQNNYPTPAPGSPAPRPPERRHVETTTPNSGGNSAGGGFPDPVTLLIDQERRDAFQQASTHFETDYYLTIMYLPPEESLGRAGQLVLENARIEKGTDYRAHLERYKAQVENVAGILRGVMPLVEPLDTAQTLTYLHACVSDRRLDITEPDVPFYIDAMLTDCPFEGGLSPRLGRHFLKTVSVRGYISETIPALLDGLNELPLEYRWVARYMPLDKQDAVKQITSLRRQWFAKRKTIGTLLKEAIFKQESKLEDSDALQKAADADAALQELGEDVLSYGYFTLTITVWDEDPQLALEQARMVQQTIDARGLVSEIEEFNAVEAWLGSLPGHPYADVRRPLVSSLSLCDLMPMSAVWPGPGWNKHLDGPPLMHTKTKGSTPFRLDLHQGDVGHTMIIGPTGAGKSTLLNLMAAQWRRYPNNQVYIFDKGASSKAMTLAVNGDFYDLGAPAPAPGSGAIEQTKPTSGGSEDNFRGGGYRLTFQPLAKVDVESERRWAHEWLVDILRREGVAIDAELKDAVWAALENLGGHQPKMRTMTILCSLIQHAAAKEALRAYTLSGAYGHLLDAEHDSLAYGAWQAFELEALMRNRAAMVPVLTYLFHRLEQRFDEGKPTLLVLDEAWVFLSEGFFAKKIREWLKVLRKKNVAVVFASQSLADVQQSEIAPALIESCLTRIFLPNSRAIDPSTRPVYESFGLNDQQLRLLATATPKREYYYQSRDGNRLFELGLTDNEIGLAFCAAGSPEDHDRIRRVLAEPSSAPFAERYLRGLGLGHAADRIAAASPSAPVPSTSNPKGDRHENPPAPEPPEVSNSLEILPATLRESASERRATVTM